MHTHKVKTIKRTILSVALKRRMLIGMIRQATSETCLRSLVMLIIIGVVILSPGASWGAESDFSTPFFSVGLDDAQQPGAPTVVLQIFLLMTVLSLAPAILIMVTSFTRIVIVLSLLRRALGTMQMPPNQVMVGIALFLTFI